MDMLKIREGKELKIGQKVRIYRNLHNGMFSIQDAKTKKVLAYGNGVLLKNVEFKVYNRGRNLVLEKKQKNVHAYVIGLFCGISVHIQNEYESVYYNPYITENFVYKNTLASIKKATYCLCLDQKCYVK